MNELNELRRRLLKAGGGAAALGLATAAGLAGEAAAAPWNKQAFGSKAVGDAVKGIGASNLIESRDIVITAPDIAENGAVVPIAVTSRIPNTQTISIVAEKNPFPLAATLDMANGAEPYASVRIKMGETSNVRAIVKADGKYYTAVKEVKVTVGGCG